MLRRLLFCCAFAVAGFAAATSLSLDSGSSASASPDVISRGSLAAKAVVTRVVDGDTLDVRLSNGKRDRVRILGIDSPEMRPKERCANQATEAARRLAQGKTIALVTDRTQATRDRYKRLLAYVTLPGGSDLGRRLLTTGHAKVYVFGGRPFLRVNAYRAAEKNARGSGFGLWGNCSTVAVVPVPLPPARPAPPISPTPIAPVVPTIPPTATTTTGTTTTGTTTTGTTGTTTTGTTTTTPTPPPTTTTPPPTTAPPSYACSNGLDDDRDGKIDYPADPGCTSVSDTDEADPPPPPANCHPSYPDFCIPPPPPDKNCDDFTQKNFTVRHDVADPDPHRLDGNKDGRACEN